MQTDFFRRQFIKAALAAAAGVAISPQAFGQSPVRPAPAAGKPVNVFAKCLQFLDYDQLGETLARLGFDGADLPVWSRDVVLEGPDFALLDPGPPPVIVPPVTGTLMSGVVTVVERNLTIE